MKNSEKTTKFNNTILTGADGGTAFSVVSAVTLFVAIVYSFIVLAAGESGKAFNQSDAGKFLSYFISTAGLIISAGYIVLRGKFSIKETCALKSFSPKYLWIILLLAFGTLFGLSWLNTAFIDLLGHFGYKATVPEIPKNGFKDFILCLLFICVLPAFFEELLFRGFILASAKRLGTAFAVITGGALFSLFHKNPAQTPYQFVMGALMCILAIKSGSLFPSVILHFINNFYIIVLYFVAPEDFGFSPALEIILGVVAILALGFSIYYLIKKCAQPDFEHKTTQKYLEIFDLKQQRKQFLIFALAGIAVCACMWIMNLFPAA